MDRYLVFAGCQYYPLGGWDDFRASNDTIEGALRALINGASFDWWHIVDSDTGTIIDRGIKK